jgi:hypothetical protein
MTKIANGKQLQRQLNLLLRAAGMRDNLRLMRALGTSFWNVSAIAVPFLKE